MCAHPGVGPWGNTGLLVNCVCVSGTMQSRRWFGGAGFSFADDPVTETLSQAIRGTGEELDREPDTGVLFGSLRGSVVGLRYYTGVVSSYLPKGKEKLAKSMNLKLVQEFVQTTPGFMLTNILLL